MKKSLVSPKRAVADIIRGAYAKIPMNLRSPAPAAVKEMIATLTATGLGDCIMLTDLLFRSVEANQKINVWARSPNFIPVMKFHPNFQFTSSECGVVNPFLVDILRLIEIYDLGNGHNIQMLRRAWGLPVDLKPKGAMKRTAESLATRVILHFEPSSLNVDWQRQNWHPRMRELYPESKAELEKFIRRRSDLEFVEVGKVSSNINGARHIPTASVVDLINLIQTGTHFIGIMSGPMHVATAYGLRCVVLCNYPKARQIVLPCLRYTGTPEENWMYPQNVHLHQEGDSVLVPKVSADAFEAAFSGDVYPFWLDDWLELIHNV